MSAFANEDEEAQHWLGILQDGPNYLRTDARLGLSRIFERRGMFVEAAELLETCLRTGRRNPELFDRLAQLYEAQGLDSAAADVRRRAAVVIERKAAVDRQVEREMAQARAEAPRRATGFVGRAVLWGIAGVVVTVLLSVGGGGGLVWTGAFLVAGMMLLRAVAAFFPRDPRR